MKKILVSLLTIGLVGAAAFFGSNAFFSDTEKSVGNTFTAGKLDLIVDIDGKDQNPLNGPIFNVTDFKPGDKGEKTISLGVDNNPSCGLVDVNITRDTGELNDQTQFVLFADPDCDNDREVSGGTILTEGTLTGGKSYAIGELPIYPDKTCYGIAYCFGTPGWKVDPTNAEQYILTCDGANIGNEAQGDSFAGDITFTAEQKRNQFDAGCPAGEIKTLDLENKDENWNVISNDNIYGTMSYSSGWTSFYGVVHAYKVEPNAKYQITLNGSGVCGATDDLLASAGGGDLFKSGYWNNYAPGLAPTCVGNPGEGIYNMDLISDWYTVISDNNGNFVYPFNLNLLKGNYQDVKVLVKKVLDPFVSPWVDTSVEHTTNLFETSKINFVVN